MQSSDGLADVLALALENPPTHAADLAVLALSLTLLVDEPEAARLAISVRAENHLGLHHAQQRIVASRDRADPTAVVAGVDLDGLAAALVALITRFARRAA